MATIQAQIEDMLATVKALREEIDAPHERALKMAAGLKTVSEDYGRKLEALNRAAASLKHRITSLRDQLDPKPPTTTPPLPPNGSQEPQSDPVQLKVVEAADHIPIEDPRDKRKRDFADFLLEFIDIDQDGVMQRINAILVDDRQDLGEMLEIVPWGEIWTVRADGETLEAQLERLTIWRDALQERLAFWKHELQQMEGDRNYWLWQGRQTRDDESWQAYLDELATRQATEIEGLQHQLNVLQRQVQMRQAADTKRTSEEHDGRHG